MKIFRSILSLITVLCILSLFILPANALPDLTTADKADILNTLSIIQGNGVDYNLKGVLKRSEAAVFIIRIMGKENYVTSNAEKYKTTKFPDVVASSWYAPYIGYCAEQNIVGGYLNGKFGPDDVISEKAFLKLVLGALSYREGTDFTWDSVYQSAYSIGLVTDNSYENKSADNNKYTRGDVVDVLYNCLTLKKKGEKLPVIQDLITDGVTTKDAAYATGVITDEIQTDIQEVSVVNGNTVSIKLNEDIQAITPDDIAIYETQKTASTLTVSIESQSGSQITIKTSSQTPDVNYSLEIYNIVDVEGNRTDSLAGNFTGYRSPEVKSDFFKISKVVPVSKNIIDVYFTNPVNTNSEIATYYEILQDDSSFVKGSSQTMYVKKLRSDDNAITICLKDKSFTDGADYTLKINADLSSIYGTKINDGSGDSTKFTAKGTENEDFKMLGVTVLNNNTLQLEFNKDINPVLAQQIFNYYITDTNNNPIAIKKAVLGGQQDEEGKVLLISINSIFDKTKSYNILINNITDITRQYSITESQYSFDGYYPAKTDLTIENITSTDANTVVVYFDRPLDIASATINSNYIISGVTRSGFTASPIKVYYDAEKNPYMVKLFLASDKTLTGTYKLKVLSTLQDYLGNTQSKAIEEGFNSSGSSNVRPQMADAMIISKDTIKVEFSKEIALDIPNILTSNYTLGYTEDGSTINKIPLSVSYIDATTLVMKFDTLDQAVSYKLKLSSVKDYAGVSYKSTSDNDNSIAITAGK